MLGFKKTFLSTRLYRLLNVSSEWRVMFSENTCVITLLTSFIWSFLISPRVVRKKSLLFGLCRNSLMSIGWKSTLMVLLEGVWVFRHVQVFFVVARVNISIVSPFTFGYKSLYMLRLWESFWLLSLFGGKVSDVFSLSVTLWEGDGESL